MQKYQSFPQSLITKLVSGYKIYNRFCSTTGKLRMYYRAPHAECVISGAINMEFYRLQQKCMEFYMKQGMEFDWIHPDYIQDDIYGNIWYMNQGVIWRPSKADELSKSVHEQISWLEYMEPNIMIKKENCLLKPYPTFKLFTSEDQEYRQ